MTKEQADALVALIYAISRKVAIEHFAGLVKDHYREDVEMAAVKRHAEFIAAFTVDRSGETK